MAHVVVVVVADHYSVDVWYFLNLARYVCVSLRAHKADRAAPGRKDGIKQDSEATGEFNIVASVTQPCRAQLLSFARRQEVGLKDGDCWWGRVWFLHLPAE